MFNICRLLFLALKEVWMIKITPPQIAINPWNNPSPPAKFIIPPLTVFSLYSNFQFSHSTPYSNAIWKTLDDFQMGRINLRWNYFTLWLNNPANIRLDEDVLKTSWRRLSSSSSEDVLKTSSRRLDQDEYVRLSLTSSEDVFKTSSRRLGQDQYIRLGYTSSRRLQDVFKTSCQDVFNTYCQDVFKTFWRRLEKRLQDIFKTSSRRIIKLNCSC